MQCTLLADEEVTALTSVPFLDQVGNGRHSQVVSGSRTVHMMMMQLLTVHRQLSRHPQGSETIAAELTR